MKKLNKLPDNLQRAMKRFESTQYCMFFNIDVQKKCTDENAGATLEKLIDNDWKKLQSSARQIMDILKKSHSHYYFDYQDDTKRVYACDNIIKCLRRKSECAK